MREKKSNGFLLIQELYFLLSGRTETISETLPSGDVDVPEAEAGVCTVVDKKTRDSGRVVCITEEVYLQIVNSIGRIPAEQGGLLGSSDGGNIVDHFLWDRKAAASTNTYRPSVEAINKIMLPRWNQNGVKLVGFIHSHPNGCIWPSEGDVIYTKILLEALGEERFILPIVQSGNPHSFKMFGYIAVAQAMGLPEIHRCALVVT